MPGCDPDGGPVSVNAHWTGADAPALALIGHLTEPVPAASDRATEKSAEAIVAKHTARNCRGRAVTVTQGYVSRSPCEMLAR